VSTTFHPTISEADFRGFEIVCYGDEDGHTPGTYANYEEASAAYAAGRESGVVDTICCSLNPIYLTLADFVNISNSNASDLLDMLGFRDAETGELEWAGSVPSPDMRARILVARALGSDVGIPAATTTGARGATMHDFGRRVGYFADVLTRLDVLLDACDRHDRDISWS